MADLWPELPLAAWAKTYETLHLWTQIVGKTRLALTPWLNHSWHVTFRVTARGLVTPLIPNDGNDFQIEFDFIDHLLWLRTANGTSQKIALRPMSVERIGKARFRVIVHEPIMLEDTGERTADIEAGVRRINRFIEERVRAKPAEWFWVHKRWPNEIYKKG